MNGVSAQAIIDAILAGERDPAKLAVLRDKRCRGSVEDIIEALRDDYREEDLFVLRQSQQTYRQLCEIIARYDKKNRRTRSQRGMRSDYHLAPGTEDPTPRRQKQPAIRRL